MNKSELVNKMATETGITKRAAAAALESFMDGVVKTLRTGKRVTLVGFGTFSVTKRAAKKGRNPATGAPLKIKAKKVGKFKASTALNAQL